MTNELADEITHGITPDTDTDELFAGSTLDNDEVIQRERLAERVRVATDGVNPSIASLLTDGNDFVRTTYGFILTALNDHRSQRDELDETIRELVEAEALWQPIVNRVNNGRPQRRPRASE